MILGRVRLLVTKNNLSILISCGRAPRDTDHRISAGFYTPVIVNELVNAPPLIIYEPVHHSFEPAYPAHRAVSCHTPTRESV